RMKPLAGVRVGIDAGIVSGEFLHLVEAMLDGVGHRLIAEMPFAREVSAIAILLKELGNGRSLGAKIVFVAGGDDDRERGADRDAPGHERGAPCGATRLAIPARERGAFLR